MAGGTEGSEGQATTGDDRVLAGEVSRAEVIARAGGPADGSANLPSANLPSANLPNDGASDGALAGWTLTEWTVREDGPRVHVILHAAPGHLDRATRLCAAFALTPAEGAVALAFARGHAPEAIAETRQTSPQTVLNQLKSIMAKTATHDRVELMRALLRVVPEMLADTPHA